MDNYGYDGADGYYGSGTYQTATSYAAEPQYANPYSDNVYSAQIPAQFPSRARARPAGINYNKHARRPPSSMILQEDLDATETTETASKPPLLSLNHSAVKRPYSGDSGYQSAKFSRGAGSRGGRGGRGGQRSGRGGGDRGGRGGRGRGGSDHGRGRGRGGYGYSAPEVKSVAGSHPAQAVADLLPGSVFEVVATNKYVGLTNRWIVTLTCPSHNNQVFVGAGPSEKVAKHEAAYAALESINPPGFAQLTPHLTGDFAEQIPPMREFRSNPHGTELQTIEVKGDVTHFAHKTYSVYTDFTLDDPQLIGSTKPPRTLYKATLTVGGQVFEEVSGSKKKAKELVCYTCLKHFDVKPPKFLKPVEEGEEGGNVGFEDVSKLDTIQDKLAAQVFNTLNKKTENVCKDFVSKSNIAAILLQSGDGSAEENYQLICVGVGAGSVDVKKLRKDGSVLHDWHAEILAIRSFRLFLFEELNKVIDGGESVLEAVDSDSDKYRLKSTYQIVMLKTSPPAGDALVLETPVNPKKHNIRYTTQVTQGSPGMMQFRCNTGYKYLTEEVIKSRDLTKHVIACPSDKLAVCNIAGVQGALLSQFIHPVYIQKYIFQQSPFLSIPALNRALYERIEAQIYKVPLPYKITKPEIESYNVRSPRVNYMSDKMQDAGWALESGDWEVIKTPDGMMITEINLTSPSRVNCVDDVEYYEKKLANAKKIKASMCPSKLSKVASFEMYIKLCQKLGKDIPKTYFACKALADEYHAVKLSINNAFIKAKLGTWPTKSVNTEVFKVDETIDLVKS